jgi:hypothetical protein
MIIPFQVEFTQLASGKGMSPFLFESILQDHFINDLAAENTSPSEKFFANAVKFFEDHCPTASITLHDEPPILKLVKFRAIFIPKFKFTQNIDKLTILKKRGIERKDCLEGEFV